MRMVPVGLGVGVLLLVRLSVLLVRHGTRLRPPRQGLARIPPGLGTQILNVINVATIFTGDVLDNQCLAYAPSDVG